jgi:pyruvate dehydrogenase E2 component (dihydrolipoamide acetyltransferase)
MPRLGWSMEEGTLVEWRKRDGEPVLAGEILCVIESEKAEQEVESFDGGILRIPPDSPPPGARVPVGTLLAWIVTPGEAAPFESAAPSPPGRGAASGGPGREPVESRSPAGVVPAGPGHPMTRGAVVGDGMPVGSAGPAPAMAMPPDAAPAGAPPAISPRARRAARELGVDWRDLRGSGRTGRIVERDVRAVAPAWGTPGPPSTVPPEGTPPREPAESVPLGGVRRVIADRMAASARTVAPVTLTTEADATALSRLREDLARDLAGTGAATPSYTDLIVKLVAVVLAEHPALNASLVDDRIVRHAAVQVGIAVDTERGLLVPVLRDVRAKSLQALAAESAALAEAARAGRLSPDDFRGGTFTVTNLGMYDIDAFTPLVNLPECAILGIGRLVARPVVVDETTARVEVCRMVTLSLTFDHRLVDGAPAARFLQAVKRHVERPGLWLSR